MDIINAADMDETYGTDVDDECLHTHDSDDDDDDDDHADDDDDDNDDDGGGDAEDGARWKLSRQE